MLRVRDIMTAGPITIGPDMTLREAAERLSHAHVSGAPVVSGDRVMGVISTTDIIDFIAATPGIPLPQDERTIDDVIEEDEDADVSMAAFYSDLGSGTTTDVGERMEQMPRPEWDLLAEHTVSEVMTHIVFSVPPDMAVDAAADYMRRAEVHRLLVIDEGRLLGIVSTLDIAGAVADHRITTRMYVFSPGPRPGAEVPRGHKPQA
ncbi:MAG TPA: CBS domain-containing protein [Gemmatimonadaceae bacterium]|jgi:CBS domain-containing protein|nr:CBS domain-containing protein [Gemmatimonadaceae bacterium]